MLWFFPYTKKKNYCKIDEWRSCHSCVSRHKSLVCSFRIRWVSLIYLSYKYLVIAFYVQDTVLGVKKTAVEEIKFLTSLLTYLLRKNQTNFNSMIRKREIVLADAWMHRGAPRPGHWTLKNYSCESTEPDQQASIFSFESILKIRFLILLVL